MAANDSLSENSEWGLLDSLQVGACIISREYRILFVNQCLANWLARGSSTLVGNLLTTEFPNTGVPKISSRIDDVFRGGAPVLFSPQLHPEFFPLTHPDGRPIVQRTTVSSVALSPFGVVGALILIEDVSTLVAHVEELRTLRDVARARQQQAEEAERSKARLFAMVSHEIRVPMGNVLGLVDALSEHPLPEDAQTVVESLRSSADGLVQILNEVLDFSKLEAKRMELSLSPCVIRDLVAEVEGLFSLQFAKKQIALVVEVRERVPVRLQLDRLRVKQILSNLVGNALKFTPAGGGIVIRVDAEATEHGSLELELSVADTGIGIESSEQEKLGTAFTQANPSVSQTHGGTGLGLMIVAELAALMDGGLVVRSAAGRGTNFICRIRCREVGSDVPLERREETSSRAAGRVLTGKRILVAEDDEVSRQLLQRILMREGAEVVTTCDGAAALAALEEDRFDLAIFDLEMPVLGGLAATEELRRHDANVTRMPIVILTGHSEEALQRECAAAGSDAMLTKPVHVEALLRELTALLRLS